MGDRGSGALWREGRLWGNSRGTAIGSHRPPRAANNMVKGAAGTAKLFGPMAPAHSKGTPRAGGVSCGRVATIEGVEFASDSLLEGTGFELSVPRGDRPRFQAARRSPMCHGPLPRRRRRVTIRRASLPLGARRSRRRRGRPSGRAVKCPSADKVHGDNPATALTCSRLTSLGRPASAGGAGPPLLPAPLPPRLLYNGVAHWSRESRSSSRAALATSSARRRLTMPAISRPTRQIASS
jgi:hypothetical protein